MPDALFSGLTMVEGGLIASQSAARTPDADTSTTAERATPSALAAAIAEAIAEKLPQDGSLASGSRLDPDAVAAVVADFVAGRSVVLRLGADITGHRRAAVRVFLEQVMQVAGTLEEIRQEATIARLAEVFLPDPLADARGALAADNLELRDRFVAETRPLTSAEVGAHAGHRGGNPYATAARWKKAGRIFSVHHRGTEYFPAFQFREGRPHPTIKAALAVLPAHLSPWQRAFWFVSANGWLGGKAPADPLDDSDAVVAAARREEQEVVG